MDTCQPCRSDCLSRYLRYLTVMGLCLMVCMLASPVTAQDTLLEWLPIRPFSFDMVFTQRTLAPDN